MRLCVSSFIRAALVLLITHNFGVLKLLGQGQLKAKQFICLSFAVLAVNIDGADKNRHLF